MSGIISLLTDFGLSDTYVGQVKGAIATVAPEVRVIDLTHDVPAHDVRSGAFLLMTSVEAFPPGTVHLAVVDPGVGSGRRPVAAASARGDRFVGPDNGLLVPALERLGGAVAAVDISAESNWGSRRSTTFHGRDLFAGVAARLARGADIASLGSRVDALSTPFVLQAPQVDSRGTVRGEVLHVDTFGNLVTNVAAQLLPHRFSVRVGEAVVRGGPHAHYAAVAHGELLALLGSAGYLEVSARDGSASLRTQARRGDPVIIEPA
ncbi:MAG TPA: SAM-dependent chlorinase/fluorinase [Myxococcaceae bacterium]|jgi:S-adenosylmethionine hydrolase|nr:SAM-dependent chlorinase/fluorinase [Myxococcaceae bacterium]